MSVTVPSESGGCNLLHSRPVIDGAPVKLWELTCAPCEAFLAKHNSDLWSATISEIAETPDETKTREDFEKRGTFDRDAVMAMAMAKLAGVDLPETLRRPLTGLPVHVPVISGQVECGAGHPNEPGMKFCGECGTALRVPAKRACPDGHEVAAGMKFCGECGRPAEGWVTALEAAPAPAPAPAAAKRLKDMRAADLQALARGKGLDDSGTRAEVLARLQAA
jgi:Double zinc ribbon